MAKPRVLLVDDEEDFVNALSERLKMRDLNSDVVYNGEQALNIVESQEPDIMVLDLNMPGMNGIDVLRTIKKVHPNIEVIILTGHGTEREKNAALNLGAFDIQNKPVDIDKLEKKIKQAFERKHGDRASCN